MKMHQYQTNLRCAACVSKIQKSFDNDSAIHSWRVDLDNPGKILTVEGNDVSREHIQGLLDQAGYKVTGDMTMLPLLHPSHTGLPIVQPTSTSTDSAPTPVKSATTKTPAASATESEPKTSYFPLLVILFYLVGIVGLIEWTQGSFNLTRSMNHFMAGFFLVFSFFKMLDVKAFADAYQGYDWIAQRSRTYALAYPFIELGLGLAYLTGIAPVPVNGITLVLMTLGTLSVLQTLVQRRKIRCACLGTVFNLPMSSVTLIEDGLMAAMALAMLVM